MKSVLGLVLVVMVGCSAVAQSVERPVQPNLPGEIMVDFGFNFLNGFPQQLDTKFFSSRSFGVYYQRTFPLNSRITFNPGIGIGNERLSWDRDMNFIQDTARVFSFDTLDVNPKKNLLVFSYLEIPVEFRFYPFSKTTNGEGFFIGLGGMIGLRFESHTKIKYEFEGDTRTEKDKSDFGLNDFRYGFIARAGWKPINVYYKYYQSELFNDGPFDTKPTMFTIGVNFSGF